MKNILFIAYQFPPTGGAGVRRSLHFAEHLPTEGYQPIIVTVESKATEYLGKPTDWEGFKNIPPNTPIYRLPDRIFPKLIHSLQWLKVYRFFWFFLFPLFWERGALWPFFESKRIAKIGKDNNCKIVYTTSSPYFTIPLGWWLKKKHGFHWVADIRDPFTECYAYSFPSKLHWAITKRIEHLLLKTADHIIVNNREVQKLYTEVYGFSSKKVGIIHNIIAHD